MPFFAPIIMTAVNMGYHLQKHIRKSPAPLKSFAYGVGYAGGTNVGYNMFNEYITPFMRTNDGRYTGRPQRVYSL